MRCPPGDLEQLDRLGRPHGLYGRTGERSEHFFEPHAECEHGLDKLLGAAGDLQMELSCSACARYLVVVVAWVG